MAGFRFRFVKFKSKIEVRLEVRLEVRSLAHTSLAAAPMNTGLADNIVRYRQKTPAKK